MLVEILEFIWEMKWRKRQKSIPCTISTEHKWKIIIYSKKLSFVRCARADARKAFHLHNFCLQCGKLKCSFFIWQNKQAHRKLLSLKRFTCLCVWKRETGGRGNETDNVVSLEKILHENFSLKWVFAVFIARLEMKKVLVFRPNDLKIEKGEEKKIVFLIF